MCVCVCNDWNATLSYSLILGEYYITYPLNYSFSESLYLRANLDLMHAFWYYNLVKIKITPAVEHAGEGINGRHSRNAKTCVWIEHCKVKRKPTKSIT